jgi:hypothetical protein
VPVDDRWRIVAYVKALQLTQQGTPADLSDADRARLEAGETIPAGGAPATQGGAGGQ